MKKVRHALYIVVMTLAVVTMAVFAAACNKKPEPTEYTLTFMNGAAVYTTITAKEGSEITPPEDPVREGYVFDGWSLSANGEVTSLPEVMPSQNTKYYARFTAMYTVTLNADIGTVSETTIKAKSGTNLYSLVSGIVPTVAGNSDVKFDGWYDGNTKLTSSSTNTVNNSNVTLTAKYGIGYTINVYKQVAFEGSDYVEDEEKQFVGTGIVGEAITSAPAFDGYQRNTSKGDQLKALSATLDENTFSMYYDIIGYNIMFNANLPADVEVEGDMPVRKCGYGIPYEVPECEFSADGYRFNGWKVTDKGVETIYRPGTDANGNVNKFIVQRAQTFVAQWVTPLADNNGRSTDRVYILTNSAGTGKYAVLERQGFEDVKGTYNTITDVFTFTNSHIESNTVLLRGIADVERGIYAYLNTNKAEEYKLLDVEGKEVAGAKLVLNEDGTAAYTDKNGAVKNGNYAFDGTDGSMKFTAENLTFYFRIENTKQGGKFRIRGSEYGVWNKLDQSGYVEVWNDKSNYDLMLDGYGGATVTVSGFNSGMTAIVSSTFSGFYTFTSGEGAYTGDAGTELEVSLINSSMYERSVKCLLMKGTYYDGSAESKKYTNVYLEQFKSTIYAKPAEGAEVDTSENAEKITLSGYSVLSNSATYKKADGSEVKGTYEYDDEVGTLRITPESGNPLLFEIRMSGSDKDAVPVFEAVDKLFGQYVITGLEQAFKGYYVLHIYNNNVAAFAFVTPVSDPFFGSLVIEYNRLVYGTYEVVSKLDDEGNPTEDQAYWEYEFSADISQQMVATIYSLYAYLYPDKGPLNIAQFGSFKFKFVYDAAEQGKILGCTATKLGDFHKDVTIEYNDTTYTLDGFGTMSAEGKDDEPYMFSSANGLRRLGVNLSEDGKVFNTVLFDLYGNKEYIELIYSYSIENSDMKLSMFLFKNDIGALSLSYNGTQYIFSVGDTTVDQSGVFGTYAQKDTLANNLFVGLHNEYHNFKFKIEERTANDNTYKVAVIYDVMGSETNNQWVLTLGNGSSLTVDTATMTATYVDNSGDSPVTHSGKFRFFNDVITIEEKDADDKTIEISLLLARDPQTKEITSFKEVRSEVGYWISYDDAVSYIYLTGAETAVKDEYTAIYYEYDEITKDFTEYEGTYKINKTLGGFDFFVDDGAATADEGVDGGDDQEPEPEQPMFTFMLATDATGLRLFVTYSIKLDTYVYMMNAAAGQPMAIGTLKGGGYAPQVLKVGNTELTGKFSLHESGKYWMFEVDNSNTVYYFAGLPMNGSIMLILLDNTFSADNLGKFEVDNVEVTIPEHGDTKAKTITVTGIETSGWLYAYVHYVGEEADYVPADPDNPPENPQYGLQCIYIPYSSNTFIMAYVDAADEQGSMPILFRFRLYTQTIKDDPDTLDVDESGTRYYAVLSDNDYLGLFTKDDLTAISLDGFSGALYLDENGYVYSGMFENVDGGLTVITYFSRYDFEMHRVFVEIDSENGTYSVVSEEDERVQNYLNSLTPPSNPDTQSSVQA